MIDAKTGFFHLVFANMSDDYYTDSYVKTDFLSYMRLKLIEDGFRYLCFIEKTPFGSQKEYYMILTGGLTESMLRETPEKKKKIFAFGGGSPKDDTWDNRDCGKKSVIEANTNTLCRYLRSILGKMANQKGFAVVCPLDIFSTCCEDPDTLKELIARQKSPNQNVMILTGSVNAAEHDSLFRELAIADMPRAASIFQNNELFPNIKRYIRNNSSRAGLSVLPKLIFTYDFLMNAFEDRMLVMNDLGFDALCNMMRYTALRTGMRLPLHYPAECYAAVIFAWYANKQFHERYPKLELPENPFREMSVIAGVILKPGFYEAADEVLKQEAPDMEPGEKAADIVDYWNPGAAVTAVIYDEKAMKAKLPEIRNYLIAYRRILKGHTDILSQDELKDIDMMFEYFSLPSYSQCTESELPHEMFRKKEYQNEIQELFYSLKKADWNCWDETAMRLLFVMFKRCFDHTKEAAEMDINNYCGHLEFGKCIEVIRYCRKKSKTAPHERNEARYTCKQAERVMRCQDPYTIKTYEVSEVNRR